MRYVVSQSLVSLLKSWVKNKYVYGIRLLNVMKINSPISVTKRIFTAAAIDTCTIPENSKAYITNILDMLYTRIVGIFTILTMSCCM